MRAQYANDPRETRIQYDLYRIPFNEGRGGTPEPVPGASRNGKSNTFPKFSPDGKWIVFVQCANGLLMRPDSQLYIMPAHGGTPRLMRCNTSLMNSWHSWSPNSRWLVFSSKCNTPYTQMFLTHVDENGNDTPPILVPNSTAANRAVNIPEFANIPPGGIEDITTPAVDYRRHLEKGKRLIEKGLLDEAAIELRTSLDMKPDYPDSLVEYGYVLAEKGKLVEAAGYCRKAIEIEPGYWPAHFCLGMIAGQRGNIDEAVGYFQQTVKLNPVYSVAYANLGNAFRFQGKLDEALIHYCKALEIKPNSAETLSDIGLVLVQQGKRSEAVPHFRAALKANPQYVPALHALAVILATSADGTLRDGKEAVRLAEIACRSTNSGDPALLDTLACALAEAGQFDDAARTAGTALDAARKAGDEGLASEIQSHLALFEKAIPYHQEK